MRDARPDEFFPNDTRVEAPGFTTYPRMTVVDRKWRDMDIQSGHLRGWWLFCKCDNEPGKCDGVLLLHPSWLVAVSAVEILGSLVKVSADPG